MEEVVRRCDQLVGTKGKRCGERVPEDLPTEITYRGVGYRADLCQKHQDDFEQAITKYMQVAEPVTARAGKAIRKAMRGKKGDAFTTKEVREWATAQGQDFVRRFYEDGTVPASGRLPNTMIDEFKEAQRV